MATQRDTRSDLSPRKVAERLKEEGKERLERGKSTAADQVDHFANALKSASSELGGQTTLGTYANQLADSIGRLGTRLRDGSIEELASDMQGAARRNPGLFIFGGLALGVVLARIVKASAPASESYGDTYDGEYDELGGEDLTASTTPGDVYRSDAGRSIDTDLGTSSSTDFGTGSPRNFGG